MEEQGKAEGFFSNVENADKLAGLVESIRDAVMDYQVRDWNKLILPYLIPISDFIATRHLLQELPTHCKSPSLLLTPYGNLEVGRCGSDPTKQHATCWCCPTHFWEQAGVSNGHKD